VVVGAVEDDVLLLLLLEGVGDVVGVVVSEVDVWVVVVPVESRLAPGCSSATTTPMTAVAPTAARTDDRVRRRSRTKARWRVSGVDGSDWCCIDPHPTTGTSPHSQGPLCMSCDCTGASLRCDGGSGRARGRTEARSLGA
jgi:hypothetical protein